MVLKKNLTCHGNSCGNYCTLCFMVTKLCMLPVKYTDDPTLGERQNKQYTNKYIVVYIFEHRQSTTTHGQGNNL